jgi:hypothetical protein
MSIENFTLSDAMAIITILFTSFSHDEKAYNILAEFTKSFIKEHPHGHLQTPTSPIKKPLRSHLKYLKSINFYLKIYCGEFGTLH